MSDQEYVRQFVELFDTVKGFEKDDDYKINPEQMDKLVSLMRFVKESGICYDGEMEHVSLVPREQCGGFTMNFSAISANGADEVRSFCEALQVCSAISFDATVKGEVSFSCTIPDVFVHK